MSAPEGRVLSARRVSAPGHVLPGLINQTDLNDKGALKQVVDLMVGMPYPHWHACPSNNGPAFFHLELRSEDGKLVTEGIPLALGVMVDSKQHTLQICFTGDGKTSCECNPKTNTAPFHFILFPNIYIHDPDQSISTKLWLERKTGDKSLTDFVIIDKDGGEHRAHYATLRVRSPVLMARHFSGIGTDNKESLFTFHATRTSADAVELFLFYIYCGGLYEKDHLDGMTISWQTCLNAHALWDELQIDDLKYTPFITHINSLLSVENILEAISLPYDVPRLKNRVADFVAANSAAVCKLMADSVRSNSKRPPDASPPNSPAKKPKLT